MLQNYQHIFPKFKASPPCALKSRKSLTTLQSLTYLQKHRTMANQSLYSCRDDLKHDGGITNGAAWYTVVGGLLLHFVRKQRLLLHLFHHKEE